MKELTIEEIVYLWSVKYKYDCILHGITFKEDSEISDEKSSKTVEDLKAKYGDLL